MANHKSALKRIKQNERRRLRNQAVRTKVKNATKQVKAAAAEGTEDKDAVLRKAIRTINQSASKGVIPRKRASRKISRLTKLINRSQ